MPPHPRTFRRLQFATSMANPVLDVLRRRADNGGRAPHRDGAKVALCIEGGSMRGVISAGMVVALEQTGVARVF